MKFTTYVCDLCDEHAIPDDNDIPESWVMLHDTHAETTLHFCCEEHRTEFLKRREEIERNSIRNCF